MSRPLLDLDVTLEHITDKSFKVSSLTADDIWVPRSLSEFEPESGLPEHRWVTPCKGVLSLSPSIAEEKGLV